MNGIIGASGMNSVFNIPMAGFLIAHLSIWAFCDLMQVRRLGSGLNVPVAIAWFLREIIALPMWLHVASGNSVQWRGRTLHLKSGGLLENG
jgi:hypothetical protein